MMNGRLANQYDSKIASRCRTIFCKQLRLPRSKRERFSPGKRSKQNELRSDRPQKRPDRNERIFRVIWQAYKLRKSIRQNWPQNWGKPQCGLVCRDSTLGAKGVVKSDLLHVKKFCTWSKWHFTTRGWCLSWQRIAPFTTRKQLFTTPEQDYSLIGHKRTIFSVAS